MGGGQNICYCHTCKRYIKSLGIARHRAAHRDREEDCEITFSKGVTYLYKYHKKRAGEEHGA